jgi:hypothetical protein
MALVLAALVGTATSYSWPHFIARGLIAVGVYAPVAFFCCLNASDRSRAYGLERRLLAVS